MEMVKIFPADKEKRGGKEVNRQQIFQKKLYAISVHLIISSSEKN